MGLRVPRDPRKTTGLIGRACKGRDVFSETVLTVDRLIIPTGFRFLRSLVLMQWDYEVTRPTKHIDCYVLVESNTQRLVDRARNALRPPVRSDTKPRVGDSRRADLSVTIGRGRHLIPSRTQKLSPRRR